MASDSSLQSIRFLNKASSGLDSSFAKISSGKRITSSKDDPAGQAISSSLDAVVVTLSQASRNTADSTSAVQIADSALSSINDISTRQAELATQAANGTLSDAQRASLNAESSQLSQEADRIVATTSFNGQSLLQGSTITTQVGTDSSSDSQITTPSITVTSSSSISVATQASATAAIDAVNQNISAISQLRGSLGASESRLDVAQKNIGSSKENISSASSRIKDLDVADESSKLISNKILQSTSAATLQQSNKSKADISKLLGS